MFAIVNQQGLDVEIFEFSAALSSYDEYVLCRKATRNPIILREISKQQTPTPNGIEIDIKLAPFDIAQVRYNIIKKLNYKLKLIILFCYSLQKELR